jgi:hypothetical protein
MPKFLTIPPKLQMPLNFLQYVGLFLPLSTQLLSKKYHHVVKHIAEHNVQSRFSSVACLCLNAVFLVKN